MSPADPRASARTPDQAFDVLCREFVASFERSGDRWLWATDANGRLSYMSVGLADHIGGTTSALIGQGLADLFASGEGQVGGSTRNLRVVLSGRKPFHGLVVRSGPQDAPFFGSLTGEPCTGPDGEFTGYRGSYADITEARRTQLEDTRLVSQDALTGIANRARMERRLDSIITAYARARRSCALMMVDLDRFKQVNDTFGHSAGDALLRQVSERLRLVIEPAGGEVGRLGGDEFQVILPDQADRGRLGELADKIVAILSQPFALDVHRAAIGASVGVAVFPHDGETRGKLTDNADLALYAAKHAGRGQYRFYSSDLAREASDRRRLERDLTDAADRGEFSLVYRPTVAAEDGRVLAMEAVLRWNHPEWGQVPLTLFMPVAEDTDLVLRISDWVLGRACERARTWPDHVRLSLAVSPAQLLNVGCADIIFGALERSGLPPHRLELNVSDQVFLHDSEAIGEMLATLRGRGVRLSLDNFGSGLSSLSYLRDARFDALRIARRFLDDACTLDNRKGELVRAIAALAGALELQCMAKGVASRDELELLRDCGVTQFQGPIYSAEMTGEQIDATLPLAGWQLDADGPPRQRAARHNEARHIHVVHRDNWHHVRLRDLSRTGGAIEHLDGMVPGDGLVLDLGQGQLAVAHVRHCDDGKAGFEFETPLVSDGAGRLLTRKRVKGGLPVNSQAT